MQTGRLVKQDIRTIWPREDRDFTPWLAEPENIALLAETLEPGPLDQVRTEEKVGRFWADVTCRDTMDRVVVIENQFSGSDHRHLGQLLTYLAGTPDVGVVIWIAETLRDEHRAVLDWLNDNTGIEFAFFGVEVEAWRIGDSAPAPKFEVVSRPNAFIKAGRGRRRAEEMEDYQRRMDYWQAFLEAWPGAPGLIAPERAPNQGWLKLAFAPEIAAPDGGGLYLYRALGAGQVGAYLSIGRRDPRFAPDWARGLTGFGTVGPEGWAFNRSGLFQWLATLDADAMDETDWPRQHGWMRDRLRALLADWRDGLREGVADLVARERRQDPG